MGLALDIGLAGLPLGIEGVELEVEIMLGRFAGVDRAAENLAFGLLHHDTFVRTARRPELFVHQRSASSALVMLDD